MILIGDCLERLKELNENSVDAIVTDPPYGLKFMNKGWDYDVPSIETWRAVFRVLKPGGHLLSFGGTRTYHRMVVSIEDAGFEIRDQIQWLYGSGFPKSLDISKAIDKKFGAKREVIGTVEHHDIRNGSLIGKSGKVETQITKPSTPEAYRYKGWGTALKPANEPICLARKPLEKGLTVAENVLKWGVGGLNIDESRIGNDVTGWEGRANKRFEFSGDGKHQPEQMNAGEARPVQGRWPSNVILGCDCEGAEHGQLCAVQMLDEQSGVAKPKARREGKRGGNGFGFFDDDKSANENGVWPEDAGGGASRFFYVAKASKRERNAGLEGMPEKELRSAGGTTSSGKPTMEGRDRFGSVQANNHPTVKPIKLMEYLIKLVTPPGGVVLDPFMGSGSTGVAAFKNNFKFIGIEMSEEYAAIAQKRINHAKV